ncbi:MAG: restriction endonuclease subunit S [Chlorobiota bacterium]
MAKKYFENYKLQIAYDYYFSNIECKTWENIHSVLDITSGDNLPKRKMIEGKYQVYGGGGLTNNSHNAFNIGYKTIGIGRVGARCGCVFNIQKNSWVTDNALLVQSFDERLSLSFLKHYLNFQNLGQFANNAMQPVISKTRISSIKLPIIDLFEQNKIANNLDILENNTEDYKDLDNDLLSKISVVDKWKELTIEIQTQKQLISQFKQAILQEAIQGKLTQEWRQQNPNTEPASELLERIKVEKAQLIKDKKIRKEKPLPPITEEEIPFELPENWTWCRLGDIISLISGQDLTKAEYNSESRGVPYITGASHFTDNGLIISRWTETPKSISKRGDLLITCKGTIGTMNFNSIGEIHIARQIMAIRDFCRIELNFTRFFLSQYIVELQKKAKSLIPGISRDDMRYILFPFPPIKEQKAIVEKVDSLMQKCNELEKEINESEQHANMLMQAVLKEAFEGGGDGI